ncbi:MAG: hypothetical protein ACK55Z_06935, partial [bacterium]
ALGRVVDLQPALQAHVEAPALNGASGFCIALIAQQRLELGKRQVVEVRRARAGLPGGRRGRRADGRSGCCIRRASRQHRARQQEQRHCRHRCVLARSRLRSRIPFHHLFAILRLDFVPNGNKPELTTSDRRVTR